VKLDGASFELALDPGELLRLEQARGIVVACTSGQLWITEEAQLEDVCSPPGNASAWSARGLPWWKRRGRRS
jgi:hypothetical protein